MLHTLRSSAPWLENLDQQYFDDFPYGNLHFQMFSWVSHLFLQVSHDFPPIFLNFPNVSPNFRTCNAPAAVSRGLNQLQPLRHVLRPRRHPQLGRLGAGPAEQLRRGQGLLSVVEVVVPGEVMKHPKLVYHGIWQIYTNMICTHI